MKPAQFPSGQCKNTNTSVCWFCAHVWLFNISNAEGDWFKKQYDSSNLTEAKLMRNISLWATRKPRWPDRAEETMRTVSFKDKKQNKTENKIILCCKMNITMWSVSHLNQICNFQTCILTALYNNLRILLLKFHLIHLLFKLFTIQGLGYSLTQIIWLSCHLCWAFITVLWAGPRGKEIPAHIWTQG